MWPCPATPLTLVLGEGNMARHAHPGQASCQGQAGGHTVQLAGSVLGDTAAEPRLSHSCPTASRLRLSHKRECQGQPNGGSGW